MPDDRRRNTGGWSGLTSSHRLLAAFAVNVPERRRVRKHQQALELARFSRHAIADGVPDTGNGVSREWDATRRHAPN